MPLSESDYKKLLLRVTGDNKKVAETLDLIWRRHDNIGELELRYAYSILDAFQVLTGFTWEDFNLRTAAGEVINGSEPFEHMVSLARNAQAYIDRLAGLEYGENAGAPLAGEMTANAPLQTMPGFFPDPNDTLYQGDPLALWRRQFNVP